MIYLDNAATSFPKPPSVLDAVSQALRQSGNPGRGSHGLATGGQQTLREIRALVARFLGVANPDRVVFTANATDALNVAIKGWVRPGDRVVTTELEHNSVLRPLVGLAKRAGVKVARVPVGASGVVDVSAVRDAIEADGTRLFVVTHASNVLGTVQPVRDLGDDQAAPGDGDTPPQETRETVVAVFEVERELFAVVKPRFDELIARYGLTCHMRMEDAQ